jgi:nucleoside phosphorylase
MASVEDYTIGCICALSIEAVALRLFLDEEYKCPEIESSYASTQDHNVYSTGAIGGHKIVVATLPLGKYGVSQATGVIGDMIRSFPNLRCCLVVGIGGGAPSSQNDIRLGDIVVSAPVLKSGGILQYDHGKAIQGQPFRITQHLNEPPSILLSAIGKLAQDYELDEHPLQNMVNDVLATKPRLKMKYQRPDDGSDRLYKSDVTHPIDTRGNCERLCGTEVSKLVERPTRAAGVGVAEIHYGIIASGSSLMKDATVRDRLSDQEEVLCFEMEAAGLVNQFPCLVIRGICDYSDSHKSDEWQGHAAMMAAAYAKEVLRVVLPRKISSTEKIVDKLSAKLNGQ